MKSSVSLRRMRFFRLSIMRMLSRLTLLALSLLLVTPCMAMPPQNERPFGPATVEKLDSDSITVRSDSGNPATYSGLSGAIVAKESAIEITDLRVGQIVMYFGASTGSDVRAEVIKLLPSDVMKDLPPKRPEGPNFGRIKSVTPLVVETSSGTVSLITSPRSIVLEERGASVLDIALGQSVMLIGGPARLSRVIIQQPNPRNSNNQRPSKPEMQQPSSLEKPPALPMPTMPWLDKFSKAEMDATVASHFGIKDAVMYRMDLLSWNDHYGEELQDLGIHWMEPAASFGIGPASVIRPDGSYDWSRFDMLVKSAQANNVHMSVIIHATEPAKGGAGRIVPSRPTDMHAYKKFVTALVERYDADGINDMPGLRYPIKHWKIEDEAMLKTFFHGSGEDYAAIVEAAYDSIKAADKKATVILSMLRGYDVLGGAANRFMDDFFQAVSATGRGPLWDVMDHHWMIGDSEAAYPMDYRNIASELQQVRASAARFGIAMRPVWCMEAAGLYSSEQAQAVDMFKRFIYAFSQGVEKVFWSGLVESPKETQGNLGGLAVELFRKSALIDSTSKKKLSYHTLKHLVSSVDGFDSKTITVIKDKDGIFIAKFVVSGSPVWIAWNDRHSPAAIDIKTGGLKSKFKIETAIARLNKSEAEFKSEYAKSSADGSLSITVDELPVIVTQSR